MKPLRLEFEGINSFSEHTIIDFEALTKNGFFGIFGDTGSGKSTILDCINFALYGNVERSREKTDIINYRCTQANVKFVFNILNEGRRKTYTVERLIKKDKAGTHKATLYEEDGGEEVCIAEKPTAVEDKIVEILGVQADDFRKCIALPQGEFAQFVKSAPRDRLALIERLFSLSKYGDRLKEKLNAKQNETENAYQNVQGRLQGYEDATENALNQAYVGVNLKNQQFEALKKQEVEITKKCEKLKVLNEKRAELEETDKKLSELLVKKPDMERLKREYSALPHCIEAVKIEGEKTAKLNDITGAIAKIDEINVKIKSKIDEIAKIEKNISDGNFEENISECFKRQTLYSTCFNKADKLREINLNLAKKREEYREIEKEQSRLLAEKQIAERRLDEAREELSSLADKDLKGLIDGYFKGAVLKGEYESARDYFSEFNSGIKVFKEDSPLYEYVSGEIANKVKEYSQKVADVREFTLDGVNEKIKNLQLIDSEREKKQGEVNACLEKLRNITASLEIKEKELRISKKEGKDLRERADELDAELKSAFGEDCKDYYSAIKSNDEKLERLKAEKDRLTANLERAKKDKSELELLNERLDAENKAQNKEVQKLEEKLAEVIKLSGLESLAECKALAATYGNITDAENVLKEYDTKLSVLTERAKTLKGIDGIKDVSDEIYKASECEKSNILGGLSQITGEIAVLKNSCNALEKRLKEKAEILKEYELIERERKLIAQLKEVTKSNKFMEFIANEYLCEISTLASSTLLKLENGRYFLTYKDNNFYVGDNFDCGNLRGVNTLSGGETFLVSLSLALALSQTICARSMKSIEFFFLDEGFGTLDSTLVDTVMGALEKLKSSDFTIGVISHVEELKNRIDYKITVNKATENRGSTVNVSC
ncbi:MAG: SMC family ATPase [Clostridia bacterium]|nr:SMC family ATPase [Clostridia bacterium]